MTYCLVKDGAIVKYNVAQKKTGLGVNSPLSTYIAKGYYPLKDNKPSIDSATQRIGGSVYEIGTNEVTKVYTVVDIPQEELDAMAYAKWKAERNVLVQELVVESDGINFDADPESQNTMTRAIQVLVADEEMPWRTADDTTVMVTQTVLNKALRIAGEAQSALWFYDVKE